MNSESGNLSAILHETIDKLPRENGRLLRTVHLPGLLAPWLTSALDQDLVEAIRGSSPTQGNGEVWYIDDEHHQPASLAAELIDQGDVARILPKWCVQAQRVLLSRLFHHECHGWSAVIFFTERDQASVAEHVDNEDVYTIQLCGSKKWTIDDPSLMMLSDHVAENRLARLNPSESWVRNQENRISFNCSRHYDINPGDFLAMPAFSLHNVSALSSPSIAFNLSICQEQDWQRFLATAG